MTKPITITKNVCCETCDLFEDGMECIASNYTMDITCTERSVSWPPLYITNPSNHFCAQHQAIRVDNKEG